MNKDIEPGICTIFCPDNEKLSSKGAVSSIVLQRWIHEGYKYHEKEFGLYLVANGEPIESFSPVESHGRTVNQCHKSSIKLRSGSNKLYFFLLCIHPLLSSFFHFLSHLSPFSLHCLGLATLSFLSIILV